MSDRGGSRPDPDDLDEQVAAGSKEAVGMAFDLYDGYLTRRLVDRFGTQLDSEDRDEVIGLVLARFIRNPQLYKKGRRSLRGYLAFCVCRQGKKLADRVGAFRRARVLFGDRVALSRYANPAVAASYAELRARVQGLVRELSPAHREVVECFWENGEDYSVVLAARTGKSKATFQTRLSRALDELRSTAGVQRANRERA
jgi:DNA-directed RNA polymerase specialized sigma24 family protein